MSSELTFLGHASFKLTTPESRVILIDPWLNGNPACPPALQSQPRADVILITHGHEDHFDLPYLRATAAQGTRIVASTPVRMYLTGEGHDPALLEPINKGGTIPVAGVHVTMTHALHHAHISTDQGAVWPHESAGYVVRRGNTSVYFAGDTGIFSDMRLIGELYKPTHAALPIGDRYTMGPLEAAHAIRLLGVQHVVPFHYDSMPTLTGRPEALARLTQDIKGLHVHALQPGEHLQL